MRQIDKHLKQLLGSHWTYCDYQCRPHFKHMDYTIEARDDGLTLRHHGFLVSSEVLPRFADIQRVHKVLEDLFDAFPKYTGDPNADVPFG